MTGRAVARSLAWALAYLLAGLLGRATVVDPGSALSLVWPAAGVGVLWFLFQGVRTRVLDVALVVALTYGVNVPTGASLELATLLSVTNVVPTLLAVWLLAGVAPQLWGARGHETVDTVANMAGLLFAAVTSSLVGAGIGAVGLLVIGRQPDPVGAVLWWGRTSIGVLVTCALGHLLLHRIVLARSRQQAGGERAGRREVLALGVVSLASYAVAFGTDLMPYLFPLLAVHVWAGMRCSPLVAVVHAVCCSAVAVFATVQGSGPFAVGQDPQFASLMLQLYLLVVLVTGLGLATEAEERDRYAASLMAAQRDAASEASLLGTLIGSMTEGIVLFTERGEVLSANDAAYRALGLQPGEALSHVRQEIRRWPDGSVIAAEDRPAARALRGEPVRAVDLLHRGNDGVERIFSVSATPLPPQPDSTRRAVAVFRDVTDDRRQREELGAFAGIVAHDLRNPLQVVDGWAEALGEEIDAMAAGRPLEPEVVRQMLRRIRAASVRMRLLIEDLLTHATSHSQVLDPTEVDLGGLVAEVATARGIEDLVRGEGLPTAHADEGMVRQLLDNLLGNAVKYVAPGVTPDVVVSGEERAGRVVVRVADNGIGVPAGQEQLVFQQFHRAHRNGYAGTGLGLAICARIVQRHGGHISVAPREGGGSVFEFSLPAAR